MNTVPVKMHAIPSSNYALLAFFRAASYLLSRVFHCTLYYFLYNFRIQKPIQHPVKVAIVYVGRQKKGFDFVAIFRLIKKKRP